MPAEENMSGCRQNGPLLLSRVVSVFFLFLSSCLKTMKVKPHTSPRELLCSQGSRRRWVGPRFHGSISIAPRQVPGSIHPAGTQAPLCPALSKAQRREVAET